MIAELSLDSLQEVPIKDLKLIDVLERIGIIKDFKYGEWSNKYTYNELFLYFSSIGFNKFKFGFTEDTELKTFYGGYPYKLTISDPIFGKNNMAYVVPKTPIFMNFVADDYNLLFTVQSVIKPAKTCGHERIIVECTSPVMTSLNMFHPFEVGTFEHKDKDTISFADYYRGTNIALEKEDKLANPQNEIYNFYGIYKDIDSACSDLAKNIIIYILNNFILKDYSSELYEHYSLVSSNNPLSFYFKDKTLKRFEDFCYPYQQGQRYFDKLYNNDFVLGYLKYKIKTKNI